MDRGLIERAIIHQGLFGAQSGELEDGLSWDWTGSYA